MSVSKFVSWIMAECSWEPSSDLAAALHPSTSKEYVLPRYDPALFVRDHFSTADGGESVLNNFLKLEKGQLAKSSCLQTVQTEVTLPMRVMVAQWMWEVCEEEKCSVEVFPLAVQFLDRFLSVECIHKHQLQALATACLFLASKVKLTRQFEGARLVLYTDESVTVSELLSWELLVLNRLDWNLSSLTAYDFLDQFTNRFKLSADQIDGLRTSLKFLVDQVAVDFRIAVLPPSMIAAVCFQLASAQVFGKFHSTFHSVGAAFEKMTALVMDPGKSHATAIFDLAARYQQAFSKPQPSSAPVLRSLQLPSFSSTFTELAKSGGHSMADENFATASTPTDIMDVMLF